MTTEELLDGLVLQNDQLEEELEGANTEIERLKQELAAAERRVFSARHRYAKIIPKLRNHYLGKIRELADRIAELESK